MENNPFEPNYYSKKEIIDEIYLCMKMLKPYIDREIPLDRDYYFNKNTLNLMFDIQYNYYDGLLENEKNKSMSKIKKLKKKRKCYKKMLSKFEKETLKLEGRKSVDEEIDETMKLIKKSIDESRSHER
jgi:hypothetical protein